MIFWPIPGNMCRKATNSRSPSEFAAVIIFLVLAAQFESLAVIRW